MGANIQINPKFIAFLTFIGLYLTTPLVNADLPNKDVMKAATCMRKVFGDDIAMKNFRDDGNILTDGEFFGIMCQYVSQDDLCKEIENNADEDYNGSAIKGCLEETHDADLFQKYVELGQKLATPVFDTLKQDEVPQKPEITQISSELQKLKLNTEPAAETSKLVDDDSEQSEDDISRPTSPQNSKLKTPVVYFKMGACQSGTDVKPVEFTELKNEKDEKDAIQCLRECTSNFLSRITILLDKAKDEAINSSTIGLSEEETKILNSIPDSSKKFTKDKFDSELDKATDTNPLSINPISELGKKYLITYDELYNYVAKHNIEGLNKKRHIELAYLDVNIFGMREMYQTCAQLGCAMTTNSTPLYNLMEAGSNDDELKVLKPFENDQEDTKKWASSHKSEWQKFCKVLMIEPEVTSKEVSESEQEEMENVD